MTRRVRVFAAMTLLVGVSSARAQGVGPNVVIPNTRPHTSLQILGSMQVPWTVAIHPATNYVAIGQCLAVYIDLLDESGKDVPRQPTGFRVSMSDFDWTATGNAAVGKYNGASAWAVCACPAAAVGSTIHVMATYPARSLAEKAKVPGLAFQSYIDLPVTKALGTNVPAGCEDVLQTTTVATAVPGGGPPTAVGRGQGPVTSPPSGSSVATPATQPAPNGASAGSAPPSGATAPATGASTPPATVPPGRVPPGQLVPVPGSPADVTAPPSGLAVSGTPSNSHITWTAVRGATSYSVRRWSQAAPECCKAAAGSLTSPAWDDANFPLSGAYVYEVSANFASGQSRPAQIIFNRPEPVNPTGFVATQTGGGAVTLTWQPVSGVGFYQLWGPGLPNTGVSVSSTSQQVTGVPSGAQTWTVGSFYTPGPVSTVGTAFTKTQLQVTPSVAAGPPPPTGNASPPAGAPASSAPAAATNRYRVVATGFRVLHQTKDDFFSRDGHGDEVYGGFLTFHYDRNTSQLLDHDLRRTGVVGEQGFDGMQPRNEWEKFVNTVVHATEGADVVQRGVRIKGGTANQNGGFAQNDVFPAVADPAKSYGAAPTNSSFPFLVWEGALTNSQDAIVILPTLWEFDGFPDGFNKWQQYEQTNAIQIWSDQGVQAAVAGTQLAMITPPGTLETSFGPHIGGSNEFSMAFAVALGPLALLTAGSYDRPIGVGMNGVGGTEGLAVGPVLPRRAIVITREIVEASLAKLATYIPATVAPSVFPVFGAPPAIIPAPPPGTIAVQLFESPADALQGQYIMYLHVERLP